METDNAERPASTSPKQKTKSSALAGSVLWRKSALALDGARNAALKNGFKPQLCGEDATPPTADDWLHETKWDGYRMLADLDAGKVALRSRNDVDWTARFPAIAAAIEALPVSSARLDGELIVTDAKGRSDFSALQRALESKVDDALRYVLFDVPALENVDLTRVALIERKALLEKLLKIRKSPLLSYSSHVVGHGAQVFEAARKHGLEGIVSKRIDAPYTQGRARTWRKIKHAHGDEFIIVGYTAPQGSRTGFGSLLLATIDRGALRYVGRVGSGFGDALLKSMARDLKTLARDEATVTLPMHVPFRAASVHWVEPRRVVEVAFRGWAKEGLLRQASFQRQRDDKSAEDLGMSDHGAKKKNAARKSPPRKTTTSRAIQSEANAKSSGDVMITHPQRIVFTDTRITKQDVADYYRAVATRMLPELVSRPLSVVRCPAGAGGTCFFQKHHAASLGANVASIALDEKDGGRDEYLYVENACGVLELVQMNVLEFHPWGARTDAPEQPDRLVFDLDPGPGVDWKTIVAGARDVRARLNEIGLESFARLSGGKGAHVVVPIRRGPSWTNVKSFCEGFATAMSSQKPLTYLATASKARRDGRIFIDWLRNTRGATSVASWSLRARAGAPVAMPISWDELARAQSGAAFDLKRALRRAKTLKADPWPDFAKLAQDLPILD